MKNFYNSTFATVLFIFFLQHYQISLFGLCSALILTPPKNKLNDITAFKLSMTERQQFITPLSERERILKEIYMHSLGYLHSNSNLLGFCCSFAASTILPRTAHAATSQWEPLEEKPWYNPRNERIYNTLKSSYLPSHPELYITKELGNKKVVIVGEVHSNPVHHLIEFRIVSTLVDYLSTRKVAIGLECFYRQHQNALDNFIYKHGDLSVLKAESDWKETWGYDLSNYARILNYAYINKIRLIGLNVPLQVVEFVSRSGYNQLPQSSKDRIPSLDLTNRKHKRRFFEMIGIDIDASDDSGDSPSVTKVHGKLSTTQLQYMYEAQTLWDEYMAESASNYILANPLQTLIVVCGVGHALGRVNMPDRIAKRIHESPFVIAPCEVEWSKENGLPDVDTPPNNSDCDWAWFTQGEL